MPNQAKGNSLHEFEDVTLESLSNIRENVVEISHNLNILLTSTLVWQHEHFLNPDAPPFPWENFQDPSQLMEVFNLMYWLQKEVEST